MFSCRLPFRSIFRTFAVLALAATAFSSCDEDEDTAPATTARNIVQTAQADANFAALVAAVTKADLGTTLSGTGPFTVFAPTNDAFAKLSAPYNTAANITAITDANQVATLKGILLYHVLAGNVKAADIASGASNRTTARPASVVGGVTLNDNTLYLTKNSTGVAVNGGTRVITADVAASNGTIHSIDNVLMPPSQTIAQIVTASANRSTNPEFTLLLQALQRPAANAILTAASSQTANVTVFAPTDAAFRTLLNGQLLSSVSDSDLAGILSRHVITTGRVFSSDLTAGTVATLGGNITVAAVGSGFTVRGGTGTAANITTANILATNGVVHVIDQVIRP